MRILYDNQIFKVQRFGGVSRYCAELMHGVNNREGYELIPEKFFSFNEHLRQLGLTKYDFLINSRLIPGKKLVEKYIRRKEEVFIYNHLRSGNFDIYHPTYYNPAYLKYMAPKKALIVTIHDMTFELYYDKRYEKLHDESVHKKNVIEKARHIITPSETTRRDVLRLYPQVSADKVTVIHHGSSLPENLPESSIKLPPRYLLYVGKRGKYKNFSWLLTSVAVYLLKNNLHLVCAGGRSFSKEDQKMIERLGVSDRVLYYDINSDEDLGTMYRKATCFIYPSSHEGFGIPILEAYSCGCPTLLARSSCFPEIGANGALYFDNDNKDHLLSQLDRILNDNVLRESLRENGYKRLKDFSWEKAVQEHIDVYRNVMENAQ